MVYHGNCHCGRYRFELHVDDDGHDDGVLMQTVSCSCAACTKQGCIWHVVPDGRLAVSRDDATLTTYRSGLIKYEFCSVCGTGLFGTHVKGALQGQRLVNLRSLRGIDPFDYDQPKAAPTDSSHASVLPSAGACLCGSVSVELLTPLGDMPLKEDNCSICTRNAWLGAYPSRAQVVIRGAQHVQDYRFGRQFMGHPFCKACGVHVYMHVYGPPQHVVDRLPDDKKTLVRKNLDVAPINIRILDKIRVGALAVARTDEGTEGYEKDVLGL